MTSTSRKQTIGRTRADLHRSRGRSPTETSFSPTKNNSTGPTIKLTARKPAGRAAIRTLRSETILPAGMHRQRHRLGAVPCVIVFGGNEKEPLTLRLELDADAVAKSLRGHSLQRIEAQGGAVWVNPQNVLYVEDAP